MLFSIRKSIIDGNNARKRKLKYCVSHSKSRFVSLLTVNKGVGQVKTINTSNSCCYLFWEESRNYGDLMQSIERLLVPKDLYDWLFL